MGSKVGGSYMIVKETLSEGAYKNAIDILNTLDDNGFSSKDLYFEQDWRFKSIGWLIKKDERLF